MWKLILLFLYSVYWCHFLFSLGFEVDKAFSFLNLLSDLHMCRLLKQLGGHTVLNLSMDGATWGISKNLLLAGLLLFQFLNHTGKYVWQVDYPQVWGILVLIKISSTKRGISYDNHIRLMSDLLSFWGTPDIVNHDMCLSI